VNYLRDFVWYRTLKRAGLRRRTMYQTRHTFASNALAAGEATPWVARTLGHRTPEMLFEVYARYIPDPFRRDGRAFAAYMRGGARPEHVPSQGGAPEQDSESACEIQGIRA
jgi:integrase